MQFHFYGEFHINNIPENNSWPMPSDQNISLQRKVFCIPTIDKREENGTKFPVLQIDWHYTLEYRDGIYAHLHSTTYKKIEHQSTPPKLDDIEDVIVTTFADFAPIFTLKEKNSPHLNLSPYSLMPASKIAIREEILQLCLQLKQLDSPQ